MSRGISASMQTEVAKAAVRPVVFAKAVFDSGTLRYCDQPHDIIYDIGDGDGSQTWTAAAGYLSYSPVREGSTMKANEIVLSLGCEGSLDLSRAFDEPAQNREASLWLGFLDTSNAVISSPVRIFSGLMDALDVMDTGTDTTLSVHVESRFAMIDRVNERRWSDADQKKDYPNDRGFEYLLSLQRKKLIWGGV